MVALRFTLQLVFLWRFVWALWALSDSSRRVLARAVLLSGGTHAFPGASDHERNNNIVKGRWRRTRAEEIFPGRPLCFK